MSIVDKVTAPVKKWLLGVALKKVVKRVAQLAVAFAASKGLSEYGFTGGEAEVTAAIYAVVELVRNFLKTKFPKQFGWL